MRSGSSPRAACSPWRRTRANDGTAGLATLDLLIVAGYLAAVIGVSFLLARHQETGEDYFLAGRRMGSVPLAMSIMANQMSAP